MNLKWTLDKRIEILYYMSFFQELHSTLTLICDMGDETLEKLQLDQDEMDNKLDDLSKILEVVNDLIQLSQNTLVRLEQFENNYLA